MLTRCCVRAYCVLQWPGAVLDSLGAEYTIYFNGCWMQSAFIGNWVLCWMHSVFEYSSPVWCL